MKIYNSNYLIPSNKSLGVNENKAELFRFLSRFIVSMESKKDVLCAFDGDGLSNNDMDISSLTPCSHGEADI